MRTVVGLFDRRETAESAINRLMAEGIDRDSISIAMKDVREATAITDATGANDLSAEGATAGLVSVGSAPWSASPWSAARSCCRASAPS